ncbi:MAG: HNH endonuclease [Anaerolineae bacterium]|jgi:hypothetical protein|nr:HNH endonuclease [Anaerolineae bacterium]
MRYRDRLASDVLKRYAASLNARARSVKAEGTVTVEALRSLILGSGGQCAWCGVSLVETEFEVDHVHSLNMGGSNTPDNLAVACVTCNRAKGDRHPARFAREKRAAGSQTDLVMRVLAAHGADDAGVQLGLFDAPPRRPVFLSDEPDDPTPPEDVPPYRW